MLVLIALAASLTVCSNWAAIADFLTEHGSGEPMSFEGISLWPPIALRVVGVGLSIWLICYTLRSLNDNSRQTEKAMYLPHPSRFAAQSMAKQQPAPGVTCRFHQ